MQVLFHVDEREKWEIALNNLEAMLNHARDTSRAFAIEIVANGAAVVDLQEEEAKRSGRCERLAALGAAIRFCACGNALRNLKIPAQALLSFVETVPAGVVEIAERQDEGYAYIKP